MSGASGGNVEKARFQNTETGKHFDVQYNPKDFKFTKAVTWKEQEAQGRIASLEFQKAAPATLVVELMFDTTRDGSDVSEVWVKKLLALLNAEYSPTDGEAESLEKKRPPLVTFIWGKYDFHGVIESVDSTYLMFGSDGNPLRAKVNIKMKEWSTKTYVPKGRSLGYELEPVKMVTLQAGETVTSVALRMGTTTQAICEDNNIDNPTDVPAGTELAVRTGT